MMTRHLTLLGQTLVRVVRHDRPIVDMMPTLRDQLTTTSSSSRVQMEGLSPTSASLGPRLWSELDPSAIMIRSKAFHYSDNGLLMCEGVNLADLPNMIPESETHTNTPMYVYSKQQLMDNINSYKNAFVGREHIIGFSLKANPNPEIIKIVLENGLSVVAVSGFEIRLALDMGFAPERIYFNGNGKQKWEMSLAISNGCIMNVDSVFNARQLVRLVQEFDTPIKVLIRLNVDLDTQVHPYLQTVSKNSKFGIIDNDFNEVLSILRPCPLIKIIGLHCHLGSTIDDVSIYTKLFILLEKAIRDHADALSDVEIVNVGGGLGINYHHDEAKDMPTIQELSDALPNNSPFTIMVEPGRSLVGNTGLLLTQVLGVKKTDSRNFVVVDGSMTELLRPTLYSAYHNILPVNKNSHGHTIVADFVGPVCESGDWLGKDRTIAMPDEGDLFVVMDAGAYCMAMASNYNLRARPAEVMVDGSLAYLIQERERYVDVVRGKGFGSLDPKPKLVVISEPEPMSC